MRQVMPWVVLIALLGPAPAAVTGRVVDADGKPVAGATVRCLLHVLDARPLPPVTTGPDGRFTLELRPDQFYPAWKTWPATFAATDIHGDLVATADGYGLAWCSCTREQAVRDLRLSPPTALEVPFTDDDGRPLRGVAVHLSLLHRMNDERFDYLSPPATGIAGTAAVTDAEGVAHFTGLPRNCRVACRIDDHQFAQLASSTENYRLTGKEPQGRVAPFLLRPGAALRGRVVDGRSGQPVAGARLAWHGDDQYTHGVAVSDADGRYVIDQLMPGTGTLAVYELPVTDGCVAARPRLSLEEGQELTGQDFTVVDGVPLTIQVEADGRPVPKAMVCIAGPQLPKDVEGSMFVPRLTDEQGRLTVRVLPGEQSVRVDARQGAPDYDSDAGQYHYAIVVEPATLVVKLTKAQPKPSATVKVIDAQRRPVAGARVDAEPAPDPFPLLTDAEGRVKIPLGDGAKLEVRARKDRCFTAGWSGANPDLETVLTITEQTPATVEALVQDERGKPLAGISVQLSDHHGRMYYHSGQAVTDAAGRATFTELWPTASYSVSAGGGGTGYGAASAEVTLAGGRGTCPPLVLAVADRSVSGWVLDPEGRPAAGVLVVVSLPSDYRQVTTDGKGEFRLTGLVRGKVAVFARTADRRQSAHAEVEAGDENVVLRLKAEPPEPAPKAPR